MDGEVLRNFTWIPKKRWFGRGISTSFIRFNMDISGMFWVYSLYMVTLGFHPWVLINQVSTWARCKWPSPTVPRVCDRTTMGNKKEEGRWRSAWEVDGRSGSSGRNVVENHAQSAMFPMVNQWIWRVRYPTLGIIHINLVDSGDTRFPRIGDKW